MADRSAVRARVGEAESLVSSARAWLFEVVGATWETVVNGGGLSGGEMARVGLAATHAVASSARAASLLYEAAGSGSMEGGSDLARAWRDVHTLTQHAMVSPLGYEGPAATLLESSTGST